MPGSKSFTGEDMVEIFSHAGTYTLKNILDIVLKEYSRPAEAGEFSQRRFLNHNLDLTRLEGAAEVVAAKTDLAWRLSRDHLVGIYGEHISGIRQKIVQLLAEIEADIDFPDEDDLGSIGQKQLQNKIDSIISDLQQLSESYHTGKIIRDGLRVIIIGPPNAGKSSLFNRLVKGYRALVTPVPGTTRDYLSEWIDIDGLPVELYDTAGLRRGRGQIEKAGIEATRKLIGKADLVISVFDTNGRFYDLSPVKLKKYQKLIIALNKIDVSGNGQAKIKKWQDHLNQSENIIPLSAKTGRGIKKLLDTIKQMAGMEDLTESLVVTSLRHKNKIDNTLEHLNEVRKNLNLPPEIISFELRQAADQIGEITGHIYTEQILDEIFSSFCIGK